MRYYKMSGSRTWIKSFRNSIGEINRFYVQKYSEIIIGVASYRLSQRGGQVNAKGSYARFWKWRKTSAVR